VRNRVVRRWGLASIGMACLLMLGSQTAQAQVKLQHKFPEGQKLKYKTSTKTRQVLTLMGTELENVEDQTVITSSTVGKKRADSTIPVDQKVDSLRIELAIAGGINVTYDSSDPNTKIDNAALAFLDEVFKLASEISYTVVLDDQNKVKAIEGAEKLLEKADKLSPTARDLIRSNLESDKFRREFEQEIGHLPDVLARPGESWDRTEILDIGNGQSLTLQKKYEYLGTEKKGDRTLDKISSKATKVELKQDPNVNAQLKVVKSDVKIESSEETILFDNESGQMYSAEGKVRVKGDNMTYSINGMDLAGTMDLTIETKSERQPAAK
jgi:Family of unknown function (DUF6263)